MSIVYKDISYDLIKGIYTVLNANSNPATTGFILFREIDTITLTGTKGTATIVNNAITKTATWHNSLTITASDFVTANASDYLAAGTILTSSGAILTFTALTPGVGFSGATTITNATFDLTGTIVSADITYPIYKSVPKPASVTYIFVGNVLNDVDGTKDTFHYNGTCQIQIVDESGQRADTKLAMQILNVIRNLLKPTKASVFSISPSTLVIFSPGPFNEVIELADNGISKIKLIDQYSFLID